jgi:hypothetical protein
MIIPESIPTYKETTEGIKYITSLWAFDQKDEGKTEHYTGEKVGNENGWKIKAEERTIIFDKRVTLQGYEEWIKNMLEKFSDSPILGKNISWQNPRTKIDYNSSHMPIDEYLASMDLPPYEQYGKGDIVMLPVELKMMSDIHESEGGYYYAHHELDRIRDLKNEFEINRQLVAQFGEKVLSL